MTSQSTGANGKVKGAALESFTGPAIDCQDLWYAFTEGGESALCGTTLQLPRGARCLLVGANGGASLPAPAPVPVPVPVRS